MVNVKQQYIKCNPLFSALFAMPGPMPVLVSALLATGAVPALAQNVAPPTLAPTQVAPSLNRQTSPSSPPESSAALPATPASPATSAPAGAEGISVALGNVSIEGDQIATASAELTAAQGKFRATLAGRHVSIREIYAATAALESAYAQAGYLLVRVTIPPPTDRGRRDPAGQVDRWHDRSLRS
jgi:hemolysin activation/secretion protein